MRKILVDDTRRELSRHGTEGFPMTVSHDALWDFEGRRVPIHWHEDLEINLPRKGNGICHVYQEHYQAVPCIAISGKEPWGKTVLQKLDQVEEAFDHMSFGRELKIKGLLSSVSENDRKDDHRIPGGISGRKKPFPGPERTIFHGSDCRYDRIQQSQPFCGCVSEAVWVQSRRI